MGKIKQNYDPQEADRQADLTDAEYQFEQALERFRESIKLAFGGKPKKQ